MIFLFVLGNMKAHVNTHTGFKPYVCNICVRAFAQKSNLNYHMRSAHNPNKPYKCDQCEKTFKAKDELSQHIRNKHDVITEIEDDGIKLVKLTKKGRTTTKKLHGCPYCGKCFAQSFNLKLHINTHTG
jgi:KRAB domain-containing zinc finger protein